MNDRLVGIDESNARGFIQGLAVALRLIMEEQKYRDESVQKFVMGVCEKLTDMMKKAAPKE